MKKRQIVASYAMQPALKSLLFCLLLFFFSQKFQCTHYASIVLMAQLFFLLETTAISTEEVDLPLASRDQSEGVARAVRTEEERREGKAAAKAALAAQAPLLFSCIYLCCVRQRYNAALPPKPPLRRCPCLHRSSKDDINNCVAQEQKVGWDRLFSHIPRSSLQGIFNSPFAGDCGRSSIAQNIRKRQREEEEELIKMKYTLETDDFPFPSFPYILFPEMISSPFLPPPPFFVYTQSNHAKKNREKRGDGSLTAKLFLRRQKKKKEKKKIQIQIVLQR